jgi:hypothetical protein
MREYFSEMSKYLNKVEGGDGPKPSSVKRTGEKIRFME